MSPLLLSFWGVPTAAAVSSGGVATRPSYKPLCPWLPPPTRPAREKPPPKSIPYLGMRLIAQLVRERSWPKPSTRDLSWLLQLPVVFQLPGMREEPDKNHP